MASITAITPSRHGIVLFPPVQFRYEGVDYTITIADVQRIDNALPVAETAHSLELGVIRCIDEIRKRVRSCARARPQRGG